jgi:dTMP kinase
MHRMDQPRRLAGRIIAFEGLDGSGKSTQIRHLADALSAEGYRVQLQKLNANRLFKQQCRRLNDRDLLGAAQAALMKAAELSGRMECLMAAVAEGTIVIWDKYIIGSLVADVAREVPLEVTDALAHTLPEPDLTVYLELSPEEALRRKRGAGGPRVMETGLDVRFGARVAHEKFTAGEIDAEMMERHFLAFQSRVADAYERYLPGQRMWRLDALASEADLARRTLDRVRALLAEPPQHPVAVDDGRIRHSPGSQRADPRSI